MNDGALLGADWIGQGLDHLARGLETVPALLVSIGAPRLERLGILVPSPFLAPELRLYAALAREQPDAAHAQYNSLIRRLVSFERALARDAFIESV